MKGVSPLNKTECCLVNDKPFECDLCAYKATCLVPVDDRDYSGLEESLGVGYRRLNDDLVREIRAAEGTYRAIGRRFGVGHYSVRKIKLNLTHKGVSK